MTAGNASGINDGAAVLLLANDDQIKAKHLKPWARIIAFAECGIDPMSMGLAPIEAVQKVVSC